MSIEPVEYLKHIQDECFYILSVIDNDMSKDDFLNNETLKRSVVGSLGLIGVATKKIPAFFKINWDSIRWKELARMSDKLIDDDIGVNYSMVWDVIKNKIPEFYEQIVAVIAKE